MWTFTKKPLLDVKAIIERAKPKYEWPDCEPIDKSSPYWEFNNNLNVNGIAYMKSEVSPGHWQWIEDEESNRLEAEMESKRRNLYWALQTRVLTEEEEMEAHNYGTSLNLESMVSYREEEKRRELQDAWFQQRRLQMLARTETAQKQPTASETNVNESATDGA